TNDEVVEQRTTQAADDSHENSVEKQKRCDISGCRSPTPGNSRRCRKAKRSWSPGGGSAARKRRQIGGSPMIAKSADGMTEGLRWISAMRPSVMRSSTEALPKSSWQIVFR